MACSYRRQRRDPVRSRTTGRLRALLPRSNDHPVSVAASGGDTPLHTRSMTFGVEVNQFKSEVGPRCPGQEYQLVPGPQAAGHSKPLLSRMNAHLAADIASEGDAALHPEFEFGCRMIHWVVFQRFDPDELVYNGLQERYCVPLDLVDGFGDSMLQAMKHSQRMCLKLGYNQDYHNALMMAFPAFVIRIYYVAYLDFRPFNPFTHLWKSDLYSEANASRTYHCSE
ncbi:hypothetical protein CABS01_16882 [Colletotrichum abscissum]|uniref:uncharacterized protein n=1 Tax=Colletotrichum abscissum TaxID=1671311 RepID=UPI0027D4D8F0|nr:uncharacterized protein CABS01_16882 [Colletotrichum abscissum]KAK1507971.1 hypothetical protein CABS01_16882 [Colletotrichum abscissum]